MRSRQLVCCISSALALVACTTKDSTELVVTVWSDFAVPSELDAVRIRVAGKEDTKDHPFPLTSTNEPGKYSIPVRLALVPAGASNLSVSVSAIGSLGGTDMVWQQALLPFVPNQAHELTLYLAKSCKNITCLDHPGYTCESGACTRLVEVNTALLPTYVPGKPPARPDAAPDSARRDAAVAGEVRPPDSPTALADLRPADAAADSLGSDRPEAMADSGSDVPTEVPLPDAIGLADTLPVAPDGRVAPDWAPDLVVFADLAPDLVGPRVDLGPDLVTPDRPADAPPDWPEAGRPDYPPDVAPLGPDLALLPDVADAYLKMDAADATGGTRPLTIQPSPVRFDAVAVGSSSRTSVTLTVCNQASTAATMASMVITGADAADFVIVNDPVTNQTIPAQASPCVYPVLRVDIPAGSATGPRTATLTVTATIVSVVYAASVDLIGSAVTGAALSASLSGSFADTAITNFSAPVVVTVTNVGALPTEELHFAIPDQQVTSSIFGDFFFKTTLHPELELAQGTCAPDANGIGTRLDPGASCTLKVWFMPNPSLGAVQRNAILEVSSPAGGRQVVDLTGKATPQLVISQGATSPVPSVTVGPTVFGHHDGPTTDVTLSNRGGVNIDVAGLNFAFVDGVGQTGQQLFQWVNKTCGSTIGKAGSQSPPDFCIYTLSMLDEEDPPMPGARATTLEVTNGANGTQKATVVVSGTAVAPPSLAFTTSSLVARDFGPMVYSTCGSTSSPSQALTFTLINNGGIQTDAILTKDVYVLDPADSKDKPWSQSQFGKTGDFIVSGCSSEGGALQPAASCVLSVAFNPTKCTAGSGSKTTPTSITGVHLTVTYPLDGVTTTVYGPNLAASAIDRAAVPYITESAGGLAPYDFGMVTATSAKITLAVHNDTATDYLAQPLSAVTITGVVADTGLTLASIPSEFAVTTGGGTGDCLAGGTTLPAAGGSCKLILTWTPTSALGTREVNVKLGASGPSIDIVGRVPTMANLVAISPLGTFAQPLDFGDAVVNVASAPIAVTIQNRGERATDGQLSVVRETPVVSTVGCDVQLAANATCVLTAAVVPAAASPQASIEAVRFDLPGYDGALLVLYAMWNGKTAAKIIRSPTDAVLNFDAASTSGYGTPVLSDGTHIDVTLSNSASTAVETGPMTFQTDNDDYPIDLDISHSTCLDPAYAFDGLTAAHNCIVRVVFSPTALMATPPSTGNLIVKSTNAATLTVPLSGTPIPSISVSATAATGNTFTATTGTASAKLVYQGTSVIDTANYPTQEFTFTKSAGSPPTGLLSTSIGGGAGSTPDQFTITEDHCLGVALRETIAGHPEYVPSCTITVRFAPTSTGTNKNAVLMVLDPSSGAPADAISVALSGAAIP